MDQPEEEEEEEVDVVVALMTWRTHPKDETGIANILTANTENLFGKIDILDMMEKSLFQVYSVPHRRPSLISVRPS